MKEEKDIKKVISEIADDAAVNEDNAAEFIDENAEQENESLNEELQNIAQMFREELNKAREENQNELFESGIVIQQLEDEEKEIPPEELCACCGEKERDTSYGENYEYCSDCRESMRHYPISFQSIIILAAVVIMAVFSVKSFCGDFSVYNTIRQGDNYLKENRLEQAFDSYDGAISALEDNDITAKRLYLKTAEILTDTMPAGVYSMQEIATRIESALSYVEAKLPLYSKYSRMHEDALILYATMQEFYGIINSEEYAYFVEADNSVYKKLQKEIESLSGEELTIENVGGEEVKVLASEPMVRFCQYMTAYSKGNSEDAYNYLKAVKESGPQYIWLYAYELGETELKNGNVEKAMELADILYENNADSGDSYALYSSIYRMEGDTEQAVASVEKGLQVKPENAELYRLLAMAYIVEGEAELACTAVETALNYDNFALLYMVGMVAEKEAGNENGVAEYRKAIENSGLLVSGRIESYLNGELTAKQLFTEGAGDVE